MTRLTILGAGSWGTALSIALAPRFHRIQLWTHRPQHADDLNNARRNARYLPDFLLPANVCPTAVLADALAESQIVVCAVPSRFVRQVYSQATPYLGPGIAHVSATKGIERGTLLRMSQLIAALTANPRIAVLSGPAFAREVAAGLPAALVVASHDPRLAAAVQTAFATPTFRLYRNLDPIGVEIGAALKNVIAIAAGICHGYSLGGNSLAALITRGLAEISRLAVALGGEAKTLAGLAGLGDLVLTCHGDLSRNRSVGLQLAAGRSLAEIVDSMRMIAEGVETTDAAVELAYRFSVEMPITKQMGAILHSERSPREVLRDLLDRSLKEE